MSNEAVGGGRSYFLRESAAEMDRYVSSTGVCKKRATQHQPRPSLVTPTERLPMELSVVKTYLYR